MENGKEKEKQGQKTRIKKKKKKDWLYVVGQKYILFSNIIIYFHDTGILEGFFLLCIEFLKDNIYQRIVFSWKQEKAV